MATQPYQILLFYRFVEIDDPFALMRDQLDLCSALGLKGRIIVAEEGLNGTVSGPNHACKAYMEAVGADERFAKMSFKVDAAGGHAFPKLSVKVRPEIVSLGARLELPVHQRTGQRLTPAEFRSKLFESGSVVIDGRNDYEYDVGHFEGALRPDFDAFRETPDWFAKQGVAKDATILTYCTGGVRCEKLTSLLIQEGYENVYQLDGGILTYGKDPAVDGHGFKGKCFVFDERITVPVGNQCDDGPISNCRHCGAASDTYVNCANVDCNRLYFCCSSCEKATERCCTESCRVTNRKRHKRGRLDYRLRTRTQRRLSAF